MVAVGPVLLWMMTTALDPQPRVVLVTIDGARWQDVVDDKDGALFPGERLMPTLTAQVAQRGVMWVGTDAMTSSLAPVSLPGYQTLMLGRSMCVDNECPRVTQETLPERIARELALPQEQVSVFASWSRLARAVTSKDSSNVFVSIPPERDPNKNAGASAGAGAEGTPWPNARFDKEVADDAIAHLEKHRPRFLYLALLDVDERAHARDKRATADALQESDAVLGRIFAWVDSLPAEERAHTTVIVTTDHGRGPGVFWFDHRTAFPSAREIFLAVVRDGMKPGHKVTRRVTQADVRPTIEALFGLAPSSTSTGAVLLGAR